MHATTVALKARLLDPDLTAQDKIDLLHNAYAGETCFILTCGPSLSEYAAEELQALLRHKLVLCVKQSFDNAQGEADFLLLNSWNFRSYDFSSARPVVVRESGAADPPVYLTGDIELSIPKPSSVHDQLAISRKFDEYRFSHKIERPWGPGVLYELGFYLAEHFGCKKVITLGWDIGVRNSPQMPHFYDTTSPETVKLLRQARAIEDVQERNRFLHDRGITYNRPRIIPEEVDDCAAVSAAWGQWLAGKGIELKIVSRQSLVDESIPRTRLEAEV
jgi:hypothetical protein